MGFSNLFVALLLLSAIESEQSKALIELLNSSEEGRRIEAIESIEEICMENPECAYSDTIISMAMEDPSINVRVRAIKCIGKVKFKDGIEVLSNIIRFSKIEKLRFEALKALSEYDVKEAWDIIKNVSEKESNEVLRMKAKELIEEKGREMSLRPVRKYSLIDPDPSRVIYTPSAFMRKKGFSATAFDLGYWVLDFTYSENVSFIFHTVLPIGLFVMGPAIKLTHSLSEDAHIGFLAHTMWIVPYLDHAEEDSLLLIGGQPLIMTLGKKDMFLNISVLAYYFIYEEENYYAIDPNIGGSIRISDRVRFGVELHFPIYQDYEEFVGCALYGLRIMGESIYGDVSFAIPIFEGMSEIMRYAPLGFPLLSFGFIW